ncbi:MAG: hypothetical protein HY930_03720 [Euryarchaeota archaeon]|nr:hypothetical protein [Euryarchaeota archaeon]
MADVLSFLGAVTGKTVAVAAIYILKIIAALVVLIVGLYAGRVFGRVISKVLDKAGLNELIRKTVVGEHIEKSGVQLVGISDLVIRWFIYAVALMAAVDILGIGFLTTFLLDAIGYIPSLVAGIVILLVGLVAVDFIVEFIKTTTKELKIEYISAVTFVIRISLYLMILVMALDQFKIKTTIIYALITPIAYGIAIGAGIGLGIAIGWGLKDAVAKAAEKKLKEKEAK